MNDEQKFSSQCLREVSEQGSSDTLKSLTRQWVDESIKTNYSYHFEWLGRPVIQYPARSCRNAANTLVSSARFNNRNWYCSWWLVDFSTLACWSL